MILQPTGQAFNVACNFLLLSRNCSSGTGLFQPPPNISVMLDRTFTANRRHNPVWLCMGSKQSWGGPEDQEEREVRAGLSEVAVQRDGCSAEHAQSGLGY